MRSKKRVCYVVCYKDPDYIRTRTLVNALSSLEEVNLVVVRNRYKGFLRYLEVPAKLVWVRLTFRPDVFVVGFRAHEIFWALYPSMAGRKIIFDEFINLHDWLVNEHKKISEDSYVTKLIDKYMRWVVRKSDLLLEDTDAHAKLAIQNYNIPSSKITTIPVGADEAVFSPREVKNQQFEVLFYGSMLPLHGVDIVFGAIKLLVKLNKIKGMNFTFIGGGQKMKAKLDDLGKNTGINEQISYIEWVELKRLPEQIAKCSVGLGGPFGNTSQAKKVVTGKTYQFLAMAKPVAIGRIENIQKQYGFKDRKNCLLIEQGSVEELAGALAWAFKHKDKLHNIGSQGHVLYKEKFSSEVISKELMKVI
jgi:glycosyltransferase involved in cell wall biosynthesis